jgi:hypothetical protein
LAQGKMACMFFGAFINASLPAVLHNRQKPEENPQFLKCKLLIVNHIQKKPEETPTTGKFSVPVLIVAW